MRTNWHSAPVKSGIKESLTFLQQIRLSNTDEGGSDCREIGVCNGDWLPEHPHHTDTLLQVTEKREMETTLNHRTTETKSLHANENAEKEKALEKMRNDFVFDKRTWKL